jgi:hypothetical protein
VSTADGGSRSVVPAIDGGRKIAIGGGVVVAAAVVACGSGNGTCGVLAVAGIGLRPVAPALDNGHINVVGKAGGGAAVGVIVATGAGSQPVVALDASGQRVTHSGAFGGVVGTCGTAATRWYHVDAHVIGVDRHRGVVVGVVVAGTTIACAEADWRLVAGTRRQRVAIGGALTGDTPTCGVVAGVGIGVG